MYILRYQVGARLLPPDITTPRVSKELSLLVFEPTLLLVRRFNFTASPRSMTLLQSSSSLDPLTWASVSPEVSSGVDSWTICTPTTDAPTDSIVKALATGASSSNSSSGVQNNGHMYILTGINIRIIIGKPIAASR